MRNEILGFRQAKLVEFDLDVIDALILRWFVDFVESGTMESTQIEEKTFYWVFFKKCIEDLPTIKITNTQALSKRFAKLESAGLIEKHLSKTEGTYTYFRLNGVRYAELCGGKPAKKATRGVNSIVEPINTGLGKSETPDSGDTPEEPENIKPFAPEFLEFLGEVVRRGGFHNRLPESPEAKPTKSLLKARTFIYSIKEPGFRRIFGIFADDWIEENGVDFPYFRTTTESRDEIVLKAVDRYALMRDPGYEPKNKKILTTSLDEFFYHPHNKRSWFLYCVFNEPKKATSPPIRFESLNLTPAEKKAIEGLRGENWDDVVFKKKIVVLCEWYRTNRDILRRYNNYRDILHIWQSYFSPLSEFLSRFKDFSAGWTDWSLANFGYGNATWKRFEQWCRETHQGLELAPTEKEIRKMKAHEDQKQKWVAEHKDKTPTQAEVDAQTEAWRQKELGQTAEEKQARTDEVRLRKEKCPQGHIFGADIDRFPECEDCDVGNLCLHQDHPTEPVSPWNI